MEQLRSGLSLWMSMSISAVALLLCGGETSLNAADRQAIQSWAASVVTLELTTPDGGRRVSGVVVSTGGLIATSYQAINGATKARVRTHDGLLVDVVGIAGVNRGKDVVLVATKRAERPLVPAKLVERELKLGEPVHAVGGPASAPLVAASDKLTRIESGQRFRMSRPSSDQSLVDFDQCRLLTHAYMTPASSGGALFGDDGQLVGILIISSDWTDRIHVAVHAGHVLELLSNQGDVRPFASLKADAAPGATRLADEVDLHHLPMLDGDALQRGDSQREKLKGVRHRLAQLPGERRELGERAEVWRKESQVPQQAFERVQQQLAANRLMLSSMVPEVLVPVSPPSPRGAPGGVSTVPAERRFSPRQVNQRTQLEQQFLALNLQLAAADAERLRFQSRIKQTDFDEEALGRYQVQLLRQVFFLGDPLELRSEADVEDSLAELDDEVDQGGAAAIFLLTRGLIRTRLHRWDEAIADFEQVIEDDRSLRIAAELARSRAQALRMKSSTRDAVAKATRAAKKDPLMETLLARCALDQGDFATATRWLREALDHDGDAIETNRALALVGLQSTGNTRDPRRAREYAQLACRLTKYGDWHSLATLAYGHAAAGEWEDAQATIQRAEQLATGFGLDLCRTWQDHFGRHELPAEMLIR